MSDMESRIYFVRDSICWDDAEGVQDFCQEHKGKPVLVDIDSTGGSVAAANRIYGALKQHGKAVGYVSGGCQSAAITILAGCRVRAGSHRSMYMLHRAFDKSDARGISANALVADQVEAIIVSKAIGRPHEVVQGWIMAWGQPDRETWFTAIRARDEGILHIVGNYDVLDDVGRLQVLSRHLDRPPVNRKARKAAAKAALDEILATGLPSLHCAMTARQRDITAKIRRHGGNPCGQIGAWG